MAKFVDRWLERVTTGYPYAVPASLLLLGIFGIVYAGSFLLEWHELGGAAPAIVDSGGKAPSGDTAKEVSAERENRAPDPDLGRNVRLRRSLLLTGSGVLLVVGTMSVACSVFWFRLARLKRLDADEPPPPIN